MPEKYYPHIYPHIIEALGRLIEPPFRFALADKRPLTAGSNCFAKTHKSIFEGPSPVMTIAGEALSRGIEETRNQLFPYRLALFLKLPSTNF